MQDSHAASRRALDEIRAVSFALHPPMLDGLGLVPALRWYLDGLQKRTNLRIELEAPADLAAATADAERTIFRVVQQSVTNVLRHSGGNALYVRLTGDGKGITLEIEGNGHGMSAEELKQTRGTVALGVGIAGMRERVQQLRGTFDITSSAQGTRVSVLLPASLADRAAPLASSRDRQPAEGGAYFSSSTSPTAKEFWKTKPSILNFCWADLRAFMTHLMHVRKEHG